MVLYFIQRFSKRASAFVLRAIAKHSASLADDVVTANALPGLISCLSEFDSSVKEAAAWALGYIAQHSQGSSFIFAQLYPKSLTHLLHHRTCTEGS